MNTSNEYFCIEDLAIHENHRDSWIVRYLEEHGFTNAVPGNDTWHRVGPWLWVNMEAMTYRYCPHYGVGCGEQLFGVTLTAEDFRTIWEIIERRQKLHAETGIKWEVRINQQKEQKA